MIEDYTTYPRDLSWLSFNYRVLQEAMDESVPLYERLRFLGIYANNLDEFYRVRVASHTALAKLGKKTKAKYDLEPERMIQLINRTVDRHQQLFGKTFFQDLLPKLKENGIELVNETHAFNEEQMRFLDTYFSDVIKPLLRNGIVHLNDGEPFLLDNQLYLLAEMHDSVDSTLVLIRVPSSDTERFIVVPDDKRELFMFIDDLIRLCGKQLFVEGSIGQYWSIKITRDAELYLEDEFEGDIVQRIKKSLNKRSIGTPTRMLYDENMPEQLVSRLADAIGIEPSYLVPGGRYHNFNDLQKLPVGNRDELKYPEWAALRIPSLGPGDYFKKLKKRDRLLNFPYESYDHILEFIHQAANDPEVDHIFITLYRVAYGSKVSEGLISALRKGKRVTVFDEVKARFDEESNIYWGEKLRQEGAQVVFSFDRIKVHCKVLLVEKRGGERYAVISTGNFNEMTARFYADHSLMTANPKITKDLVRLKDFLADQEKFPNFKELLVAPYGLRSALERRIAKEIRNSLRGKPARIWLKLNSLEDVDMIERLYDASIAGVEVRLIIRGICCLVPGIPNQSDNIEVISIVDRYLEHSRMYIFENGGDHRVYLSSADWMRRNLSARVEVAVPVLDESIKQEVLEQFQLQWADGLKARVIDEDQTNPYRELDGSPEIGSQHLLYNRLKERHERNRP